MSCKASELDFAYAVFDCDGVILDSNPIKTEAFRHALSQYPASKVDELVEYHLKHGGVSRYEKFRYFFGSLIGESGNDQIERALEGFRSYCQAQLLQAPLVPGVRSYLDRLANVGIPVFIVTGSDQVELIEVLRQRKLLHYFERVLGSPTPKRDNLKALLRSENLNGPGVFYGDARLDHEIATEQGLSFVFVYGYSDWQDGLSFCRDEQIPCVADFRALAQTRDL